MATVDHHDAVLADREALIDWRDVIVDVGDRVAGLVADGGTFEEVGGG